MFCPKCGNTLPDDAAFCGNCGNKIEAKPKAVQGAASAASNAGGDGGTQRGASAGMPVSGMSISATQILAVVFAAVAIIFGMMPWFETSDYLLMAGRTGSSLSSALTLGTYSTANFEEVYTLFGLMDFQKDLATYYSSSSSGGGMLPVIIGIWAVGLVLLLVGAIMLLLKGNKVVLIIGTVVTMGVALYYNFGFYNTFIQADYAVMCMNPIICAIAALVALIMAAVSKKPKKEAA